MDLPGLDDLRGATLDELTVDWRNGIALLEFLPSATRAECRTLRATGLTHLALGRAASASALVQEARFGDASPRAGGRLELTMKSGEVMTLDAASFAIAVTAG